jgi:hypothetical protein
METPKIKVFDKILVVDSTDFGMVSERDVEGIGMRLCEDIQARIMADIVRAMGIPSSILDGTVSTQRTAAELCVYKPEPIHFNPWLYGSVVHPPSGLLKLTCCDSDGIEPIYLQTRRATKKVQQALANSERMQNRSNSRRYKYWLHVADRWLFR